MIVYIHGLAANGSSEKVDVLRQHFGVSKVVSPDFPFDPLIIWKKIDGFMSKFDKKDNQIVFLGSNYGAFYANYFAHYYDRPAILINPVCDPSRYLKKVIGKNINYMTGEEFEINVKHMDLLDSFKSFIERNYNGNLIHLFLAENDMIQNHEQTLVNFPWLASLQITSDGGHKYKKYWHRVIRQAGLILERNKLLTEHNSK